MAERELKIEKVRNVGGWFVPTGGEYAYVKSVLRKRATDCLIKEWARKLFIFVVIGLSVGLGISLLIVSLAPDVNLMHIKTPILTLTLVSIGIYLGMNPEYNTGYALKRSIRDKRYRIARVNMELAADDYKDWEAAYFVSGKNGIYSYILSDGREVPRVFEGVKVHQKKDGLLVLIYDETHEEIDSFVFPAYKG
jgi:hypothetical protein